MRFQQHILNWFSNACRNLQLYNNHDVCVFASNKGWRRRCDDDLLAFNDITVGDQYVNENKSMPACSSDVSHLRFHLTPDTIAFHSNQPIIACASRKPRCAAVSVYVCMHHRAVPPKTRDTPHSTESHKLEINLNMISLLPLGYMYKIHIATARLVMYTNTSRYLYVYVPNNIASRYENGVCMLWICIFCMWMRSYIV